MRAHGLLACNGGCVKKRGLIAGTFDLIHPGYIKMFQDAKSVCDHLIIALQEDPSLERSTKYSPLHTLEERKIILNAIKYVDEICVYKTEKDLENLLKSIQPDYRILGSDYKNDPFTGDELNIEVYYHERDHDWSYSRLRRKL